MESTFNLQRSRQQLETLEIVPKTQIAIFRCMRTVTIEGIRQDRKMIAAVCRKYKIRKVLLDYHTHRLSSETLEAYGYGSEFLTEMRRVKIAVVHHHNDELWPFIVTVAWNRGANIHAFSTLDKAQAWLQASAT